MPPRTATLHRRLSPWGRVVAGSALVVVGALLVLATWAIASRERRITTYAVRGTLNAVQLDLGGADADVTGGGREAGVQQIERVAFGHRARVRRSVTGGVLRIRSRCPRTVLRSCMASYRITVPDNVFVTARSAGGDVSFRGFQGSARILTGDGDIRVRAFCGFSLQARAQAGDVTANLGCAPEDMTLRSATGSVHAVVPPGRYRIDADSNQGTQRVTGLTPDSDAPFGIQALSSTGDVVVEARR